MLDTFPLLLSIAVGAAAASGAQPPVMPLRLEVRTEGGTRVIEVVASSAVACSARYQLEINDTRGGNRSVTGGTTMIQAGARQTIATVRLGPGSAAATLATLNVEPIGGSPYQQSWPH